MAHFCQSFFCSTVHWFGRARCSSFIYILYRRTYGPFLPNYFLAHDFVGLDLDMRDGLHSYIIWTDTWPIFAKLFFGRRFGPS